MPNYAERMRGAQGALMAPNPNVFSSQDQLVGSRELIQEAVRNALMRRAQGNLQDITGEQLARGGNIRNIGQLLSMATTDPRVANYLQERGVIQPGEMDRERGIRSRMAQLQAGPGVSGTMEALGTGGLRVQESDVYDPNRQQNPLDQLQSQAMKQRLMDILGGGSPGHMNDLWTRIKSSYR